jgi:uncharacterized protein (TIGR00730 family)
MVLEEAKILGRAIVEAGHSLVYGGADSGAMGALADACLHAGGHVTGVFPTQDLNKEIAHSNLADLIYTKTLWERKQKLAELSEGFVVFPGGTGTLDEFYEILVLKQLAEYQDPKPAISAKPIVLFNAYQVWNPLLGMMEIQKAQGLVDSKVSELYHVAETTEETLGVLNEAFK